MLKYKVQEHQEVIKEFAVYQVAPNGELCKRIAGCREKKDADLIACMLNDKSEQVPKDSQNG